MSKIMMGPSTPIFPMSALLVGANVNGKPNFMTVASGGIANVEPPMISVAINNSRYTLIGMQQNMTFSVNVPSVDLVREADYCGIIPGNKVDKVEVCQFKVFYGKLDNAPLVEQCPVNMECKVMHILNLGSHSFVIGRIEEIHVSESCLTDEKPDIVKINPLAYIGAPHRHYQYLGEVIAKAFSVGLELRAGE